MRLFAFNFKYPTAEAAATAPIITVFVLSPAAPPVIEVPRLSPKDVTLLNYNVMHLAALSRERQSIDQRQR